MSKIEYAIPNFTDVKPDQLARFVSIFAQSVLNVVNGKMDFASNFNCVLVTVNITAANLDVAVTHGLGHAAIGYITYWSTCANVVYNGVAPWTNQAIFVQSASVGQAKMIVF